MTEKEFEKFIENLFDLRQIASEFYTVINNAIIDVYNIKNQQINLMKLNDFNEEWIECYKKVMKPALKHYWIIK